MTDVDIDDLMNDLNNTKGKSKKPKKKGKKEELEKENEPQVQESSHKVEQILSINKETITETTPIINQKIEEPKPEKDEKNDDDQQGGDDEEETQGGEKETENEVGDKKKKVVKKVIKKVAPGKGGKKDKEKALFAELAKKHAEANKLAEEERKKKDDEERKRIKEEEERFQREEEERKKREAEEEAEKKRKLEELKKLGLTQKEYVEYLKRQEETLKMLKDKGIGSIDELTKVQVPQKANKKKHVVHKKEEISDNNKENLEQADDKKVEQEIKEEAPEGWESDLEDDINIIKTDYKKVNESESIIHKEKEKQISIQVDEEENNQIIEKSMRCPIICILGHVDTGKTKLLDKLRNTNVQKGEAGGITQQIGATLCPLENIKALTDKIVEKDHKLTEVKLPGLLIIDTPGHASFQNLRVRGQSLCDIAILVIDIMHGLELQTIDSLKMLKEKKTPFIIALNKVDQIYGWKKNEWTPIRESLNKQNENVKHEFNNNLIKIQTQIIKEVGLNTALYWENPSMREYFNIVPTSAITGEGIPDLMNMCLFFSQTYLPKKLTFKPNVECSVLEVKVLEKVGTTIDIVLVNGHLKIGDKIIVAGLNGPIRTEIKYILTPHPMKELRVKSEYIHNKEIKGALGCKIFALKLEEALAGSPLYVYKKESEADVLCKEINDECLSFMSEDMFDKTGRGVLVVASSLGALEAIMSYLQEEKIPVAGVNLGYVQKKDVIKIMTIHNKEKEKLNEKRGIQNYKEDLCILAFDVNVNKEAQEYADKNGVAILTAEIIYHLNDKYKLLVEKCHEERKKEKMKEAIFPVKLKILPEFIINRVDPIIIGVDVVEGILKKDTPLYCVEKKKLVGTIDSIHKDGKEITEGFKNNSVSIRIKSADKHVAYKTHFDGDNFLVSNLSRTSIDRLKEFFYEELFKNQDYINLIKEIKGILEIK